MAGQHYASSNLRSSSSHTPVCLCCRTLLPLPIFPDYVLLTSWPVLGAYGECLIVFLNTNDRLIYMLFMVKV